MTPPDGGATVRRMPLWELTVIICGTIWVLGTIALALGWAWLSRHEPH